MRVRLENHGLASFGQSHKPKKSLGQNFLVDPNIRRKIIEVLELRPSDIILEIGAGKGELTGLIAPKVDKIYALEIDRRLYPLLTEHFKVCNNVSIINQDILKFDLAKISNEDNKIKVFGNIPYYISSPIIEHLIKYRAGISEVFITVQKEFAKRVVAGAKDEAYGSFSCFVQYYAIPKIVFEIKRGCFYPTPKVDSCLLKLRFRDVPAVSVEDEEALFKVIRAAFNQRRKTLRNSLKGKVPLKNLECFFFKNKLNSNVRPEELSLEDFASLVNI